MLSVQHDVVRMSGRRR